MQANPLVITGMGVVSAAGLDPQSLWNNAFEARSPATWQPANGLDDSKKIAACAVPQLECPSPNLQPGFGQLDRCCQLGLNAAYHAYEQARLAEIDPGRLGIVAGTSRGPVHKGAEILNRLHAGQRTPAHLAPQATIASLSGALALRLKTRGPAFTVSASCASAGIAIILGAQQILAGEADAMLVGGSEAPLTPAVIQPFSVAGLLGTHADPRQTCRPFDRSRNGTLLGEGAGFLVLEPLSSAQARGAIIHGCLRGWASGTDPGGRAAPSESAAGLSQTIDRALDFAGLSPDEIDYVNVHGTGTRLNDQSEARALTNIFGSRRPCVPCSSTKPITGHCLGATAALEAVLCLMAMAHQKIPPTLNCLELDPECPLDVVPHRGRPHPLRQVMSLSQGFWGHVAALAFGLPPQTAEASSNPA
jgi:3-oxoacyl-(acyl-carrier-protein) synthase